MMIHTLSHLKLVGSGVVLAIMLAGCSNAPVDMQEPTNENRTESPPVNENGIDLPFGNENDDDDNDVVIKFPTQEPDEGPTNQAPIARVRQSMIMVNAEDQVVLDASASSDPDQDALSYRWQKRSGPPITLLGALSAQASFRAPSVSNSVEVLFEVFVSDGALEDTATQIVLIRDSNDGTQNDIIADAGPDRYVLAQSAVTLDASASYSQSGAALTYEWEQLVGPQVDIQDPVAVSTSFVAPAVSYASQEVDLYFELTVASSTESSTDILHIVVVDNPDLVGELPEDPSSEEEEEEEEEEELEEIDPATLGRPEGGRTPQWPLKTSRVLYSDQQIAQARQLCNVDPEAVAIKSDILEAAEPWLSVSDAELHLLLPDSRVPRAINVSKSGCPVHGAQIYQRGAYPWITDPMDPFHVECPIGHEKYPSNDFSEYYKADLQDDSLLTGAYADDGRGWLGPEGEKFWFVAYACHWNWRDHWIPAVKNLSRAYVLTGDRQYARKAIVLLDRIAQVYPRMDYDPQSRMGELLSSPYKGKILNLIWETLTYRDLVISYDLVFDALIGQDAEDLPWRTADQIRANIEANFFEEGLDSIDELKIYGNYGSHQSAQAYAIIVRQNGPTDEVIDEILHRAGTTLLNEGLEYAFRNLLLKDGMAYEIAPNYNHFWVDNFVRLADALSYAGIDLYANSKMERMFDAPLQILCAYDFTPNMGDYGEISHIDWGWDLPEARNYRMAYRRYGKPEYAWALQRLRTRQPGNNYTDFEELFREPVFADVMADAGEYQHEPHSRALDGRGLAILNNANDSIVATGFYGLPRTHGHYDQLNMELFAHGSRVAPDNGRPDATNAYIPGRIGWTNNTISHNTLMVDESKQSLLGKGQLLRLHDGQWVHVMDIEAPQSYSQTSVYRRTLVMVDIFDDDGYLVDVFRVRGGQDHVLSIHGEPGTFNFAGATLTSPTTVGTLAGANVAYEEFYDDPILGQPGYSGPYNAYQGSGYQYLFNWQSANPSQIFYGQWSDESNPGVHLRVHAEAAPGQEVIVADAYDSPVRQEPLLKYMLLRRDGGPTGNTFITVWEPYSDAGGPLIDSIVIHDDAGLGSGSDRIAVLEIHRGNTIDYISVSPQPGTVHALNESYGSNAAVTVLSETGGTPTRVFAAGGTAVTGTPGGLSIPVTLGAAIQSVDYANASVTVNLTISAAQAASLAGKHVRIYNADHSCVYRIDSAIAMGNQLRLNLAGSEVFTGRIKMTAVNTTARTITTPNVFIDNYDLAGKTLVTDALSHTARITGLSEGIIQLQAGSNAAPFASDLATSEMPAAWISDIGPQDQIEIERFVE